ncbi:MAG: HAMP domain-containing sensor histidine kinase [Patescibacteria group bacterium]
MNRTPTSHTKQRRTRTSFKSKALHQIKAYETQIQHLQEASRSKDEFIRITNHELRTPLDVIRGNLDMILKGESGTIPDRTREYLEDVLAGADRLARLVNDMLDISRIKTGRINFILEDIDIGALLGKIENEYASAAQKKHVTLKLIHPRPSSLFVFSDSARIIQIIVNLIGNALKFTPAGGTITISAQEDDDMVKVTVKDTGIGIRPEDQKKLFKQFPEIDLGTYDPGIKGTGLGLFLIHQLVSQLGGTIGMESLGQNKGSSFFFRLPMPKSAHAEALIISHTPPQQKNNIYP